jgi:hypothetical protein
MAGKIFYRERQIVKEGVKRPRFRIVGVSGLKDTKIYVDHLRKGELEHLAEQTGAELVCLRKGSKQEKKEE